MWLCVILQLDPVIFLISGSLSRCEKLLGLDLRNRRGDRFYNARSRSNNS